MGDESNILVVVIIRPRHDDNLVVVGIPAPPNPPNPTLPPPPPSPPPGPPSPEKTEDWVRSDETIKLVRAAVCVALQTRTRPHGRDPSSNGPNLYRIMQLLLYVL